VDLNYSLEHDESVTRMTTVRYEKDPNVVSREIAGERILVPIRTQAADMAAIYVLNETGARIWDLMDGQHSLLEIQDILVNEYDVSQETAGADIAEMVGQLEDLGMLRAD
jgi:hypothetical protein